MLCVYVILAIVSTAHVHAQNCPAGQEWTGTACENCAAGEYKDGATVTCAPCPIGYYQPYTGQSACNLCPTQFITPTVGSTLLSQCSIANCSVGYYRDLGSNQCVICPVGTYQATKWKVGGCTACDTSLTTDTTGSTSPHQCVRVCPEGKEERERGICEHCLIGYYKADTSASPCSKCPDGTLTFGTGSTDVSKCNIDVCYAGEYRSTINNACVKCPLGSYQESENQATCRACPLGASGQQLTTLQEGSTGAAQCVFNCESGKGYVEASQSCEFCPQGQYRTQGEQAVCTDCPTGRTTPSAGSIAVTDCSMAACPAGAYYVSATDQCLPCPKGTYQPQQWQRRCLDCPDGTSTAAEGASSASSCISIAILTACSVNPCLNGGSCVNATGVPNCVCATGYQGNLCQLSSATTTIATTTTTTDGGAAALATAPTPVPATTTTTSSNATTTLPTSGVSSGGVYRDSMLPFIIGGCVGGALLIVGFVICLSCLCSRDTAGKSRPPSSIHTDYSLSQEDYDSRLSADQRSTQPVHGYTTGPLPVRSLPRQPEPRRPLSAYNYAYQQSQGQGYSRPSKPNSGFDRDNYHEYNWREREPPSRATRRSDVLDDEPEVTRKRQSDDFYFYEETASGPRIGRGLEGYDLNVR